MAYFYSAEKFFEGGLEAVQKHLKQERETLSYQKLGDKYGVSYQTIRRWERGLARPSERCLMKFKAKTKELNLDV